MCFLYEHVSLRSLEWSLLNSSKQDVILLNILTFIYKRKGGSQYNTFYLPFKVIKQSLNVRRQEIRCSPHLKTQFPAALLHKSPGRTFTPAFLSLPFLRRALFLNDTTLQEYWFPHSPTVLPFSTFSALPGNKTPSWPRMLVMHSFVAWGVIWLKASSHSSAR